MLGEIEKSVSPLASAFNCSCIACQCRSRRLAVLRQLFDSASRCLLHASDTGITSKSPQPAREQHSGIESRRSRRQNLTPAPYKSLTCGGRGFSMPAIKCDHGHVTNVSTPEWIAQLTLDQMRRAVEAPEAQPKRAVWRVCRGGICEAIPALISGSRSDQAESAG